MKKVSFLSVGVLLFFLTTSLSVFSQLATTSLRGAVTDASGAVVPGATVSISRGTTGATQKTTTGASGEYQFLQLQPGTYIIKTEAPGFGSQSKSAELLISLPANVNFKLSVQASTETVNVTAETATLNTQDASLGDAVDNKTIMTLPMIDRNVPALLSLQPGVLYLGTQIDTANDSRSGSVNGSRSDQGNVTMDGVDDNDQLNGYAFTGVLRETLDSVDEFRVNTSNYNSEQGRSSGAQIDLLTKSGTNNIHGSLYEYNRNTYTAANDWFNKAAQAQSGLPNVPGKFIRNTFGAAAGGPFKRDKFFWFGNYEGQRTSENQQITQTVPFASFKQGNVSYLSNGSTVTLTPADIAKMDPNCSANGTCPWGPGDDPNILSLFNKSYPTANGSTQGDGLNLGSYSFSSPDPASLNTSIARLDYIPSERHRLFVRGDLQKDIANGTEQFPGLPPSFVTEDNSKGIAGGETWTITNHLINDVRYGYVRQGFSNRGIGNASFTALRFMSQPVSETFTTTQFVPVHNVVDNMTWTRGNHTVSYGINFRHIANINNTNNNSFNNASTNEYWLFNGGNIAGVSTPGNPQSLDPSGFGFAPVDSGFTNSYNIAVALATGLVPQSTGNYNFLVSKDGQTANTLPQGAFVGRDFVAKQFEYYIQDSWHVQPNVTLTFGLRHLIQQTPYEANGQQVAPTIDTHKWFATRVAQATLGNTVQPDISFAPSGQGRGLPAYWPMNWGDVAPRGSLVWAPNNKTTVRMGLGMFYDNYGEGIVDSFNQLGSFGLTTSLSNPAGVNTVDNSPRFTGIKNVPPLAGVTIPSVQKYPYTPPDTGFLITWGVDSHLKTPYSIAADYSVQRELPHGYSIEADYVGRFGRHLLQQLDLAEPLNLVDPKSGMDYYTAAKILSKAVDAGAKSVNPVPYWEDLFPYLAGNGASATQNIYANDWIYNRGNETTALANIDFFCSPNCGPHQDANGNPIPRFYQRQFSSLYAWASIGSSSYNAAQLNLRKVSANGFAFNFSYTLSNSIDMGSDAQRTGELGTGSFSEIINSFYPQLNRAVSDFDTRHLFSGDVIDQLPFGKGKQFAGNANTFVNALIGDWTVSGIGRVSSGLPFGVIEPQWSTNWQIESWAINTAPVKIHKHLLANGAPEVFANPTQINNGVKAGSPIRLPYAGEVGQRNAFRGDGYFDIDSAVAKVWNLPKGETVRFDWEVFNVTNSVRFDTSPVSSFGGLNGQLTSGTLGQYSSALTLSRKQQFSLRYSF